MDIKLKIRQQILNGALTMPTIKGLEAKCSETEFKEINNMFESMFHRWLLVGARENKHSTSMPYWAKKINNVKIHNVVLKVLSEAGWITVSTRPANNWSEAYINEEKLLEYCTREELDITRLHHKFKKYKLTYHELDQDFGAKKIKRNGKVHTSKISREGFAKAGKVPFQFDTKLLAEYQHLAIPLVNKGIDKMIVKYPGIIDDHANYQELGKHIVESLIYESGTYNSGPRTSDPRGRDNAGYLSKIGNPVGFKVMRHLLVIPEEFRNRVTAKGLRNKFLFVAELNGFKKGTVEDKLNFGRECWYNATLPDIYHDLPEYFALKTTYQDITDALDNGFGFKLYLSRISEYLDNKETIMSVREAEEYLINKSTHKWVYPIEIDMSASVLGYIGLLLNHRPFLDRCNILPGDLSDAWGHDVVTNRNQFKTIMRRCYGSQMAAADMWRDMDIEFTQEEVDAFEYELEFGEMAVANVFKDFIINNANMTPVMELNVDKEWFTVECNRHYNVGESTSIFDMYDTATKSVRTVHNTTTVKVPDLKSFRRFSVTGLIHNLDGQVEDNTTDAVIEAYGWALPIHDATLLCAEAADYGRHVYSYGRNEEEPSLKRIHTNRNSILQNYFRSINIPASAVNKWKRDVVPHIVKLEEELNINPLVLK